MHCRSVISVRWKTDFPKPDTVTVKKAKKALQGVTTNSLSSSTPSFLLYKATDVPLGDIFFPMFSHAISKTLKDSRTSQTNRHPPAVLLNSMIARPLPQSNVGILQYVLPFVFAHIFWCSESHWAVSVFLHVEWLHSNRQKTWLGICSNQIMLGDYKWLRKKDSRKWQNRNTGQGLTQ